MVPTLPPGLDRAAVERIARECPGVRLVVLFGSVARGTARADSDADIGVLGGQFWDALKIGSEVGARLGREPQVVDLEAANDLLRFEAARDGAPLFEAAPDAWRIFQAQAAIRYFEIQPLIALCAGGARRRLMNEASRG